MYTMTDFPVRPVIPERVGVHENVHGTYFTVAVPGGQEAELLLYRKGEAQPCQVISLPEEERIGEVSSVFVAIDHKEEYEYNYRIGKKMIGDPYTHSLRRHVDQEGRTSVRGVITREKGAESRPLEIPYHESILYKIHVKGFTMQKPAGVKHPGTFLGVEERIPYLKELGINGLILMPVYEFLEREEKESFYELDQSIKVMQPQGDKKENYWGYTDGLYFAPKESYAASDNSAAEFAALVDALHKAGIECILEFYFAPDTVSGFVTDVLHYWRCHYAIDGFRLMGWGNWIHSVVSDPMLRKTKLLFTSFDTGAIYRDKVPYVKNLGEMNGGYQQLMRRFLKGDADINISQVCEAQRAFSAREGFVQYLVDHDGFTLADMVSYEEKHNQANGENNRDGNPVNLTWNCGVEGPTRKASVQKLRRQQARNAMLLMLTSQGTPMLYGGDEVLNSQDGNNNAWCQDNPVGWISWGKGKNSLRMQEFVKEAIAFRKAHPILHMDRPFRMSDYRSCGIPDISYHSEVAWMNTGADTRQGTGILYCGEYAAGDDRKADDTIYIICNMYWQDQKFALPKVPGGREWVIKADTASEEGFYADGCELPLEKAQERQILVRPRSIMILLAK